MMRLLLIATMAFISGCVTTPDPIEPSEAPESAEDSLRALLEANTDLLDSLIPEQPMPTPRAVTRALESQPAPDRAEPEQEILDFWQQLVANYGLDPLPDEVKAERQWRSLRNNTPSVLTAFLARGQLWLHYIAQEIENRGMPAELALLPYVESGFQLKARSNRGAAGPWQLMPATAEYLGLSRSRTCDQRLDVLASTDAALDYLEFLGKEFDGDWFQAIAAYNSGPGRVGRAIKANEARGRPTDYWSLRLPTETKRYVPRLLALAEVIKDPERFGVTLPPIPTVPVFETIRLSAAVDLQLLADWSSTSIDEIRELNPCLRRFTTPPEGGLVAVPVGTSANIQQQLANLPPDQWAQLREYVVKRGDTLGEIALRFDTSVADLKATNGLTSNMIRIGQTLRVQGGNEAYAAAAEQHKVKAGESLWTIARQYGLSLDALRDANRVGRYLQVGQVLTIPAR